MKLFNQTIWAITPEMLQTMMSLARENNKPPEAIAREMGKEMKDSNAASVRDGVCVIRLCGPLFRYANLLTKVCGATSYELFAQDFNKALKDPNIKAIVLDIDSPGGEVNGCSEVADIIYKTRGQKTISKTLPKNQTIWQIVNTQKIDLSHPVICFVNGVAKLRKDWSSSLSSQDVVSFVALPLGGGGGGSNPIKAVLTVALIVATVYTGGAVGAAYGAVWGGVAAAGVSMAGGILINTFVPTPKPALNGMTSSAYTQSPTYSLQAQGNEARLGNPIPVIYGRHLIYPDFASQPYYRYIDNEQYVYQLHCIGQGEYDVEQIRIEDTPISSFEEITCQIIRPNEKNTLFDEDVITSAEVAGQELLKGEICGPFILNSAETMITKIEVDVAFQRGCYYANDSGGLSSKTIQWKIEVRSIDDNDAPLGEWYALGNESITEATHNGIYKTYTYDVPAGRYEIRATRLDDKDTSSRAGHEIRWSSAKGYIISEKDYGNVTLLAIIMKATDNLSQRSSRLVNCIVTRKLKTWSPLSGWSPSVEPTRSIAWALADILKASYGANLKDNAIDLQALYDLDRVWNARGDICDIFCFIVWL